MPYQLTEAIRADILEHGDLHTGRIQQLAARHSVPFYQMRDWCVALRSKPNTDDINARAMRRAQQFIASAAPPSAAQLAIRDNDESEASETPAAPTDDVPPSENDASDADEADQQEALETNHLRGFAPRPCANPECRKVFVPKAHATQRYCSLACGRYRQKVFREPRTCANPGCSVTFTPPDANPNKRYCSTECAYVALRGPRKSRTPLHLLDDPTPTPAPSEPGDAAQVESSGDELVPVAYINRQGEIVVASPSLHDFARALVEPLAEEAVRETVLRFLTGGAAAKERA